MNATLREASPVTTSSPGHPQGGWRLAVKAAFDRLAACVGLVLLSPLLATVALAIRVDLGSPVLFVQERPGRGGRPFRLVKFRTMREAIDANGLPLPDDERLGRLGRFLRACSLDELPQLWNVLRGDLSLVGPRPLLMRYLPRFTPEQARRHEVLPGVTGWAQVNGRNAIAWEEKFAHDVWYVDHWSLSLDARILLRTLGQVLHRSGISREGHATMPEFLGSGSPPSGQEGSGRR
jgi:lipopolysaccharide/colanic/teichoic acid biosynthesis glycosyltransferase